MESFRGNLLKAGCELWYSSLPHPHLAAAHHPTQQLGPSWASVALQPVARLQTWVFLDSAMSGAFRPFLLSAGPLTFLPQLPLLKLPTHFPLIWPSALNSSGLCLDHFLLSLSCSCKGYLGGNDSQIHVPVSGPVHAQSLGPPARLPGTSNATHPDCTHQQPPRLVLPPRSSTWVHGVPIHTLLEVSAVRCGTSSHAHLIS